VDVTVDALVAGLARGAPAGVLREVEARERAGGCDRGDGYDGDNDESDFHEDTFVEKSVPAEAGRIQMIGASVRE
jgi:hypothetical protein